MNVNILDYQVLQNRIKNLEEDLSGLMERASNPEDELELHSCPFCGGDVKIYDTEAGYSVHCINETCYMHISKRFQKTVTPLEAFDNWNDSFEKKVCVDETKPSNCPLCGSAPRTLVINTKDGDVYYTICGNRRCELEDITGLASINKEQSVKLWNARVLGTISTM